MRNGIRMVLALGLGALLVAPSVDATSKKRKKATHTRSPHHCMKDGAVVAGAHKKDCRAGGGKWMKVRTAAATPK